jgi:uncharacterized membrane protein
MIEYRKKLKSRLFLLILGLIAAVAVVVTGSILSVKAETPESTYLDGMVKGFPLGLFTGFCVIMIVLIVLYIIALSKETALKKMYINENDERRKKIRDSAMGKSFFCTVGILVVGETVASFYNNVVAITLMSVLAVHVFAAAGLKLYYTLKY